MPAPEGLRVSQRTVINAARPGPGSPRTRGRSWPLPRPTDEHLKNCGGASEGRQHQQRMAHSSVVTLTGKGVSQPPAVLALLLKQAPQVHACPVKGARPSATGLLREQRWTVQLTSTRSPDHALFFSERLSYGHALFVGLHYSPIYHSGIGATIEHRLWRTPELFRD